MTDLRLPASASPNRPQPSGLIYGLGLFPVIGLMAWARLGEVGRSQNRDATADLAAAGLGPGQRRAGACAVVADPPPRA